MDFWFVFIVSGYLFTISSCQTGARVLFIHPRHQLSRSFTMRDNQWARDMLRVGQLGYYPREGEFSRNYWNSAKFPPQTLPSGVSHVSWMKNPSYTSVYVGKYPSNTGMDKFYSYKDGSYYRFNEVQDASSPVGKSLYFEDYPHLKALLMNQKVRLNNDLAPNKLGSLRFDSPFYRP